ncbi:hypothetical protein M3Y94_00142500 [Aphelenchoides besseyi]|nr:hypothetical protein M3Y94_00142500 [Aphelenchoides besseyi]
MHRSPMNPYGPPTHGFGYPRPPFAHPMMSFGPPRMQMPPRIPHFEVPLETPADDQEPMEETASSEASSSANQMRVYPTRLQTFDQYVCEQEFPRCEADDALGNALLTRNQQITPTTNEQTAITNLMSRIKTALEQITAIDAVPSVKIDEYREVGSYKKRDDAVEAQRCRFGCHVPDVTCTRNCQAVGNENRRTSEGRWTTERSFRRCSSRLWMRNCGHSRRFANSCCHFRRSNRETESRSSFALRHAYWFDEHAGQPAIKILVRLIKDIKSRTSGFAALDVWTIELLCHYCITCTPDRQQLPLVHAFRRFFQMISSGFLLHTSVAVADPCDQMRRINHGFDPMEADTICRTSQFITRLLIHEKYDRLMATNKSVVKDVALEGETDPTLNIAPLKAAYNRDLIVNHPPSDRFYSRIQI